MKFVKKGRRTFLANLRRFFMKCDICGRTDEECRIRKINGNFMCPKHISQWYRYKKFLKETIYDNNEYIIHEDFAEILLKNKNCEIAGKAIIDLEDVDKCKKYKWHLKTSRNTNYAIATINEKEKIFLHRLILDYKGNDDIDHIDLNGLNNRKSNLRIIKHSDNIRNQSINRKGISKKKNGKYTARITVNYKEIYIGTFDSFEEALEARLKKEKEIGH